MLIYEKTHDKTPSKNSVCFMQTFYFDFSFFVINDIHVVLQTKK